MNKKEQTLKGWIIGLINMIKKSSIAQWVLWIFIAGTFFYLAGLDYVNLINHRQSYGLNILFSVVFAFLNNARLLFIFLGILCVIPLLAIITLEFDGKTNYDKKKISRYHLITKYIIKIDLTILLILLLGAIFLSSVAIFFNLFAYWNFNNTFILILGLMASIVITIILGIALKKGISLLVGEELVPTFNCKK